ncbi:MAG: ABC transporter ATP-binding protein [Pseudomonadota bacterium]
MTNKSMTELSSKNLPITKLVVRDVSVRARDTVLVENASFTLQTGELTALLGPNGAGKTSLIRAALGLQPLDAGAAELDTDPTAALDPVIRARKISYLPQQRPLAWPARVRDVVALGRFSHGAAIGRLKPPDAAAVDRAVAACDLHHLADRSADTLSGGERARMHCARAFAAEAPLLIADEPTAALDPRHQFRVMDLMQAFVAKGGGVLVVLHDVQLAARYASRLIWMKDGRIVADGTPEETLNKERLETVYGVRAHVDGGRVALDGAL